MRRVLAVSYASAAQLRIQIEGALQKRIPSALAPAVRSIRPTVLIGIAAIGDLLQGVLPIGAISEIVSAGVFRANDACDVPVDHC